MRFKHRDLSDGWHRSICSCSAASARARCSALMCGMENVEERARGMW